jgi:hypothetical protein
VRQKPANGTYRLTPDEKYHRPAYDVAVSEGGCGYAGWGSLCPWNQQFVEFRRTTESGWQFGWVCFGARYLHFAIDPAPLQGASPFVFLDEGTCEAL